MKDNIISELFHTLKRRPELQAVIPMGYTPGLPMLNIRQDNLCVEIPFLRYKVTGEKDRTLVYPVRYVATYLVPEMQMIRFTDPLDISGTRPSPISTAGNTTVCAVKRSLPSIAWPSQCSAKPRKIRRTTPLSHPGCL